MASDPEHFSTDQLFEMFGAGLAVLNCHRLLAKTGDNIVGELIKGHDTFFEWDHYPPGDVYDGANNSQFYYHAHPQNERTGEHGHFHTFLHPEVIPSEAKPLAQPDLNELDDDEVPLCHLIGISMDKMGLPIRFFTTNRWVTGEILYSAELVSAVIDRFEIDLAQPSWPVNVWVSNMVRLYRPQLKALLAERDDVIEAWRREHPDGDCFEDRDLEVTSVLDISVDEQLASVRAALEARGEDVPEIG